MSNVLKALQARKEQEAKTKVEVEAKAETPSAPTPKDPPGEGHPIAPDLTVYPKGPKGSFKALRLQRFTKANGVTIYPVDGYFVPNDQEEYDTLVYFLSKNDLVGPEVTGA